MKDSKNTPRYRNSGNESYVTKLDTKELNPDQ